MGCCCFGSPRLWTTLQLILRAFRFLARHGLRLSSGTEAQIERAFPALEAVPPKGTELWHPLQEILLAPHAADALRAMHSLRLITLLFPELRELMLWWCAIIRTASRWMNIPSSQ